MHYRIKTGVCERVEKVLGGGGGAPPKRTPPMETRVWVDKVAHLSILGMRWEPLGPTAYMEWCKGGQYDDFDKP